MDGANWTPFLPENDGPSGRFGWVKLGAIAGMTSVMLVVMLGKPRIFCAMSVDGLLPPLFRRVRPTHQTPYVGTLVTGSLAALIAGLFPVTILGELFSIGTLLAFTTVCIGVLVLRYTRPDLRRPFKVPVPWLFCTAGAIVCLGMMLSLPPDTRVRLAGWTVVGFLIYVLYGFRHSALRKSGRQPVAPPIRGTCVNPPACPLRYCPSGRP